MQDLPQRKINGPDIKDMPEPKPRYPYYPPDPTEEEMKRMEMLNQVNHWANNDPDIARATAKTFIELLKRQFDLPGE